MTIFRHNERSMVIDLIVHINLFINQKNILFKSVGGEKTISATSKIMFPDMLLYTDELSQKLVQGWEVKMPDTSITDRAFIADATRKAKLLNLRTFFIWNFKVGILYILDDKLNEYQIHKTWNVDPAIQSRQDVSLYKKLWLETIDEILVDLSDILMDIKEVSQPIENLLFENIMQKIVNENKGLVSEHIKKESISNSKISAYIDVWWNEVRSEFSADEVNGIVAYSKTILVNWLNRFLFAHLIKRFHMPARRVENIAADIGPKEANFIFKTISEECDFYNIFIEMEFNYFLPSATWLQFIEFNEFLSGNNLDNFDYKSLQNILEKSVTNTKRELSGFYTTPPSLAEILAKMTVSNWNGNIIDPCCGTGTIANSVLQRKLELIGGREAMETTWASDKNQYPLQMATIGLTNYNTVNEPSKVFKSNVFNLINLDNISIINPSDGNMITIDIPRFDYILSNLPFISSKLIDAEDALSVEKLIKKIFDETGETLSKKADLYSYIIFGLHDLLNENGTAGLIISNAWLGSSWGKSFYRALNFYYNIEQVHMSATSKWFENADVVATILIIKKRLVSNPKDNNLKISFFKWNKTLKNMMNSPQLLEELVNSSILNTEINSEVVEVSKFKLDEIATYLDKSLSLNSLFHKPYWMNALNDLLIPLSRDFIIMRGERRGWDNMFYPESGHEIEDKYIKRVIKNARSIVTMHATPDNDAFCCSDSIRVLKSDNQTGALTWIEKFANQTNGTGLPLPVSLRRPNHHWYEMRDDAVADIITSMNPGSRLFFAKLEEPSFINQRLIGLKSRNELVDTELSFALLNSIVGLFLLEGLGFGRGLGALDINSTTLSQMYILNGELLSVEKRSLILESFSSISSNKVGSVLDELDNSLRTAFDNIVLTSFGIEQYYDDIKSSLKSMHSSRISV